MAGFACQRHMHSVNTCIEHPLCARRGARVTREGVPSAEAQGDPSSLREESLPEFTAKQNDTSKSKAELPQGKAPPRDLGRGRVSPPGSLSQNPEDPALALTVPPKPGG